jgi:hypothetical protein
VALSIDAYTVNDKKNPAQSGVPTIKVYTKVGTKKHIVKLRMR